MENKEKIYDEQIKAKVDELKELLNKNKIPCFIAIGVGTTNEKKFITKTVCLLPELYDINDGDGMFADFVNVERGFTTVPFEETDDQLITYTSLAFNTPEL